MEFDDIRSVFGPVPEDLPALVGRVVMLGALLETKLEGLASQLGAQPPMNSAGRGPGQSIAYIKKVLPEYRLDLVSETWGSEGHNTVWSRTVVDLLVEVQVALVERNRLAHGIWAGEPWQLWKPSREREPSDPIEWAFFPPERFDLVAGQLVDLIHRTEALAGSVPVRGARE